MTTTVPHSKSRSVSINEELRKYPAFSRGIELDPDQIQAKLKHKNENREKQQFRIDSNQHPDVTESKEYIDSIQVKSTLRLGQDGINSPLRLGQDGNKSPLRLGQHDGINSNNVLKPSPLFGVDSKPTRDIQDLENLLSTAGGFILSAKLSSEQFMLGKSGYELVTLKGCKIGYVLPDSRANCFDKLCCHSRLGENDPLSYTINGVNGEVLLSIIGLDEDNGTEDTVIVLEPRLKRTIGTVFYGFPGAADTISIATSYAGRDRSYMLPVSVVDAAGDLAFIFRRQAHDVFDYTEILSADGRATIMADIVFDKINLAEHVKNYNNLKKSESASSSLRASQSRLSSASVAVVTTPSPLLPTGTTSILRPSTSSANEPLPRRRSLFRPELVNVFRVHFLEELSPQDKVLLMGVSITVFNRWLTNKPRRHKSKCTIV